MATTNVLNTPSSAAASAAANQDRKKRKLDHEGFRSSKYFKICAIVKDLRPFFVEVAENPNFRNSKAAQEILMQMKILIELTDQLRSETTSAPKPNENHAEKPLLAAVHTERKDKQRGGETVPPQYQPEKEELKKLAGTPLVGGSPIGWNFLIYPSQNPIFYGLSKEIALARRAAK